MRRLLTVLAALALPAAVLAVWVGGVVGDTDRWVATVSPLADEPAVQREVEDRLVRQTTRAVDEGLGAAVAAALEPVLRPAARTVVEGPAFPRAWEAAHRDAHGDLLAILEDRPDAPRDGRISVGLDGVVRPVVEQLAADAPLPIDPGALPSVPGSFAIAEVADVDAARTAYVVLDRLRVVLPLVWLALAGLALLVGRARALRGLGVGALAGAVVVLGVAFGIPYVFAGGVPEADVELARAVADVVTRDLRTAGLMMAAAGLAAVVVGALAGRLSGGRAPR